MDIVVIGAGLSGISAGGALKAAGHKVTIYDKGRTIGGRCATRQTSYGPVDHGLQFLDLGNQMIAEVVDTSSLSLSPPVPPALSNACLESAKDARRPLPYARSLADSLAGGLDIHTSTTVTAAKWRNPGWDIYTSKGVICSCDAVVFAIPPQQAKTFALEGHLPNFDAATYHADVLAIAADDAPLPINELKAASHAAVGWIGYSPDDRRAVIFAGNGSISDFLDMDKNAIAERLWVSISDAPAPSYLRGHRWRYSRVVRPIGEPFHLDKAKRLGFCGDWFLGANAEHALESGHALAQAMAPIG